MRVILIAAKQREFAKTRLAAVFPPAERMALAEAMYRDVLDASLAARAADRVAVVTSDSDFLDLAREAGAIAIDENGPRGLNAAVALATADLAAIGAERVCTVLSDVPLVTADDIDAVITAMPDGPGVVLVPSRDFSGTNIIARAPSGVVPTRFGRLSLVRHLDDCRRRGLPCEMLRLARPGLDLDLPGDLQEFVRCASHGHTLGQLVRLGVAQH